MNMNGAGRADIWLTPTTFVQELHKAIRAAKAAPEKALSRFERLLSVDDLPVDWAASVYAERAKVYMQQGRAADAYNDANAAVSRLPTSSDITSVYHKAAARLISTQFAGLACLAKSNTSKNALGVLLELGIEEILDDPTSADRVFQKPKKPKAHRPARSESKPTDLLDQKLQNAAVSPPAACEIPGAPIEEAEKKKAGKKRKKRKGDGAQAVPPVNTSNASHSLDDVFRSISELQLTHESSIQRINEMEKTITAQNLEIQALRTEVQTLKRWKEAATKRLEEAATHLLSASRSIAPSI
eukprot:TRINITY_DN53724_c0_g1_i1.p1 TRINITY_DN53724_c0_g1~~TRINITY_DN53724_c0_g1_i1.p1  ORF type:complete len:299 (-),score=45.10 TRINITY_DN53724_c0_g1_i1:20-916(-)